MADALWIDQDYLMENSVIAENSDMKVITPNIIYVQDAFIKPLLGTDLFNVVNAQIIANSYTSRISTLLDDYLKKVILNYVLSESASDFVFRWMNKGIVTKNSENSQQINPEQLKTVQEKYRNRGEIFAKRTRDFLLASTSTYPEFNSGNTDLDDIQPTSNIYNTGIWLGDSDEDRCDYIKRNV